MRVRLVPHLPTGHRLVRARVLEGGGLHQSRVRAGACLHQDLPGSPEVSLVVLTTPAASVATGHCLCALGNHVPTPWTCSSAPGGLVPLPRPGTKFRFKVGAWPTSLVCSPRRQGATPAAARPVHAAPWPPSCQLPNSTSALPASELEHAPEAQPESDRLGRPVYSRAKGPSPPRAQRGSILHRPLRSPPGDQAPP